MALRLFGLLTAAMLVAAAAPSWAFETSAKAAILIDFRSGQVLYEKNADEPRPPASMSKLMTAYMVFDQLRSGSLSLDDELPVSERAWRFGGSKMYVEVDTRVAISDLLRGIIVQSGNDACIVVAEALSGSEEAFAADMSRRAKELGLENSNFMNASGWPAAGHVMSVRDLALLASRIIREFPEHYPIYSMKEFTYSDIVQYSRNPLLRRNVPGVDGLKTGYTQEAGYGLVASAVRDGRRLVLVVAGLETPGQRSREAERLLEYGYREFEAYALFRAGETVVDADVWLGDQPSVALTPLEDVIVTMRRAQRDELAVRLRYEGPPAAPIEAGQQLGELVIDAPGVGELREPLAAAAAIGEAGMADRVRAALDQLIWGGGGETAARAEEP